MRQFTTEEILDIVSKETGYSVEDIINSTDYDHAFARHLYIYYAKESTKAYNIDILKLIRRTSKSTIGHAVKCVENCISSKTESDKIALYHNIRLKIESNARIIDATDLIDNTLTITKDSQKTELIQLGVYPLVTRISSKGRLIEFYGISSKDNSFIGQSREDYDKAVS